jgi:hypothetical protein
MVDCWPDLPQLLDSAELHAFTEREPDVLLVCGSNGHNNPRKQIRCTENDMVVTQCDRIKRYLGIPR